MKRMHIPVIRWLSVSVQDYFPRIPDHVTETVEAGLIGREFSYHLAVEVSAFASLTDTKDPLHAAVFARSSRR